MLGDANVAATIAVKDLEAAKKFYVDKLGLNHVKDDEAGGAFFKSGDSVLYVYTSQYAGTNKATYAGWSVKDIESVIKGLSEKGVTFEHYDNMGERQGDIHVFGDFKAAWFKDPDGNILALDNSSH